MTWLKAFFNILAGTVSACAVIEPLAAQSEDDKFYAGKRIQIIVGSGAGGGYDNYARQVSRYLGRFLPGNPSFVVQNMPGAGGVVAANYVANLAPKDGTFIGAGQREVPLIQLMGQQGPRFKTQDLQWLGSLSSEPGVCAVATRKAVNSVEDFIKTPLVIGGTGPNITEFLPALMNNLMGTHFKLVKGYVTTMDVHLAISRGEADAICQSWASYKPQGADLIAHDAIKPVLQANLRPEPEMTKRGIPMIFDLIQPQTVAKGYSVDDVKAYFKLLISTGYAGRPFFVAPEVPGPRAAQLRQAFARMATDPEFIAEAIAQQRDLDFVSGEDLQKVMAEMAESPPKIISTIEGLMQYRE